MRRNAISSAVQDEEAEINMTPMLDVVFIMLIFFIVTANFIKEPGLEINRPDASTAETQENAAILIAIGASGEIWMDGRRIDARQVKANVVKLLADNPQGSVVIQADEKAMADTIIKVMDGAREAGVFNISLASEPKSVSIHISEPTRLRRISYAVFCLKKKKKKKKKTKKHKKKKKT